MRGAPRPRRALAVLSTASLLAFGCSDTTLYVDTSGHSDENELDGGVTIIVGDFDHDDHEHDGAGGNSESEVTAHPRSGSSGTASASPKRS